MGHVAADRLILAARLLIVEQATADISPTSRSVVQSSPGDKPPKSVSGCSIKILKCMLWHCPYAWQIRISMTFQIYKSPRSNQNSHESFPAGST